MLTFIPSLLLRGWRLTLQRTSTPNHLIILVVTVEKGSVHLVLLPPEQREPGSLFQVTFEHEVSVYHLKKEVDLAFHLYCHGDERVWGRTLLIS